MDRFTFPTFTNVWVVLSIFAAEVVLFHLLLVFWLKIGKRGWKIVKTHGRNQIGLGTFLRGLAGEVDFPRLRLEPAASACASNPMPRTEGPQARQSVRKR